MNICLHSIDKVGDALLLLLKPGGPAAVVVTPSIVIALQKHYASNFPGKRLVVPSHFNEFFIPKTMEHIAGDIISTKVSVPLSPPPLSPSPSPSLSPSPSPSPSRFLSLHLPVHLSSCFQVFPIIIQFSSLPRCQAIHFPSIQRTPMFQRLPQHPWY